MFATYLLGPGEWFGHTLLRENFVPHTDLVGIIGLIFCGVGVTIACWSRVQLGKNWSLSVQQKENHELISSGAYKIVRHPIYTGLLLMFFGTSIIVGDWRGLIAVAIITASFWVKLRKEEQWLIEVFGDEYVEYKNRTNALIPWLV
jgi:protein-S-isoprenylcysteine O-methyltransferase Ste14